MRKTGFFCRSLFVLLLLAALCAAGTGLAAAPGGNALGLTGDEIRFMEEHPVIRLGVDPEFIPYEFFDSDGEYKGIAADYLALIAEKTGLQFEVARGLTWSEAYESAVERDLDALPCVSRTAQREKYFLFSNAYISFQRVMFVNEDNRDIKTFEDLYGKTAAVQRNSSHHSYLSDFEQIKLSLYTNVEDALRAVADGTEVVFIGNLATSNYLAKSNGITNLQYIPINTQEPQSLYFAARSDWPELIGIVNKALAAIDEESRIAISDRWISVQESADYTWLIRLVLIAAGVAALIVLVSFFWITKLRKEIRIRKQSQADLEEARRAADEANRFKSRFLARMSHEIRTPLNGIIGMAYLLKKTKITMTQTLYVDRISLSSNIMLSIINDILDFSKIEAGKVELEITPFSIDDVIKDVVGTVLFKIEEQKIGFRLVKDPAVPNWFFGDAKRIEQILINILNNAAKFTSAGEVSLDVGLAAKENDRCRLVFTVKDTGIGMSAEQVDKLFTPFEQGDTSINRRFGGTGLGLSIVKNLVDLMEGEILVSSTPGEGSVFTVHLPLTVDMEKEAEYRKNAAAGQFRNLRTLVMEKTEAGMNLLQTYLESFGMPCEATASQQSALRMLRDAEKAYDLLIVDFETPEEGVFQFVDALLADPGIAHKPRILVLIPMMREDLFDKLGEYSIDAGIGKPIIPSVLLNSILDIFRDKAVAAARASEQAQGGAAFIRGQASVLVADDNQTNQLIAESLLKQAGITVLLADNGKAAVEVFGQNRDRIDLILMDLHMPVMNGYEASAEIRKVSSGVPIVALTADVNPGIKEQCERYGIHHYLTKPFDPDDFIRKVCDLLKTGRAGRAPETGEAKRKDGKGILDTGTGLRNMGQNPDLYRDVLKEYRSENLETPEKLRLAVQEKRFADAAGIVHKLKSSSGSIGAAPLYELAVKLQAVLKEGTQQEADEFSGEFIAMLNALLLEIGDRVGNTA